MHQVQKVLTLVTCAASVAAQLDIIPLAYYPVGPVQIGKKAGQGCCRDATGGNLSEEYILKFKTGDNGDGTWDDSASRGRAECGQKCDTIPCCVGFEFHQKTKMCELFDSKHSPVSVSMDSKYCRQSRCYARDAPLIDPPSGWDLIGRGCCRDKDGLDSDVAVDIIDGIFTIEECKAECEARIDFDCVGIEVSTAERPRCELYNKDFIPFASESETGACSADQTSCHVRNEAGGCSGGEDCSIGNDIAFLVDTSGSLTEEVDFAKIKAFIKGFVAEIDDLEIASNPAEGTQIAGVSFNDVNLATGEVGELEWDFNLSNGTFTFANINDAIDDITVKGFKGTKIGAGMEALANKLFTCDTPTTCTGSGYRGGSTGPLAKPPIVIVITDGSTQETVPDDECSPIQIEPSTTFPAADACTTKGDGSCVTNSADYVCTPPTCTCCGDATRSSCSCPGGCGEFYAKREALYATGATIHAVGVNQGSFSVDDKILDQIRTVDGSSRKYFSLDELVVAAGEAARGLLRCK